MNKILHKITVSSYVIIVVGTLTALIYYGYNYYQLPLEERFYHPHYDLLKPSGFLGHGLGVLGTISIIIGISTYWIRKRSRAIAHWGSLSNWLNFHIFMCTLGTILVLFHTTFKFGGLVSVGFWSMIVVFLSGVVGRYIYLQIPKTLQGDELTMQELKNLYLRMQNELFEASGKELKEEMSLLQLIQTFKGQKIPLFKKIKIALLFNRQKIIARKMKDLDRMKRIFRYWHVIHLPFALIMLIIMVIHVGVVAYFGYWWVFN